MRRFLNRIALVLLFALVPLGAQAPLRVCTYNIESLGGVGSTQWNRALDSIGRIAADVVGIQEVGTLDVGSFSTFAAQAGYASSVIGSVSGTLSGGLRAGVLSQYPIVFSQSHSASSISGDPTANDMTRDIFEVHVQPPGLGTVVGVFVVHFKSGTGSSNDFRRGVEIMRSLAVLSDFDAAHPGAPAIFVGDFNEDLGDGPFGTVFNSVPSGMPATFVLGNDVSFPFVYEPFQSFQSQGWLIADATQEDSTSIHATRDSSGRRLDYVLHRGPQSLIGDEVYNSVRDNGFDDLPLGNWLAKSGSPLASSVSLDASDHFPVFADLTINTAPPAAVLINEVDPCQTSNDTEEFVELYDGGAGNTSLAGLVLVFFNGATDSSYSAIDLTGSTNAQGFYLVGTTIVPGADQFLPVAANNIQNGADAVAIYAGSAASWPPGSPVNSVGLVDAVVYGTNDPIDAVLLAILTPTQPQVNESAGGSAETQSIARCPDGGTALVTTTYATVAPSPGQSNSVSCGGPVPFAFDIDQPVACGNIDFSVVGAAPGGELFNLIALECAIPAGSGPLFGLSVSPAAGAVLAQAAYPLGTQPFHVLADAAGTYDYTILLPGVCAGITLNIEGVSLVLTTGIITQVSPTTGCVPIAF